MSSETECRKFCVSEADCIAVDFNLNDRSCWIHYCTTYLEAKTYHQDNTTQFRLNRTCQHVTTGMSVVLQGALKIIIIIIIIIIITSEPQAGA